MGCMQTKQKHGGAGSTLLRQCFFTLYPSHRIAQRVQEQDKMHCKRHSRLLRGIRLQFGDFPTFSWRRRRFKPDPEGADLSAQEGIIHSIQLDQIVEI